MRLLFIFLVLSFYSFTQKNFVCGFNHSQSPVLCDFVANQSFISNKMVLNKIKDMVNSVALPQNFVLVECDNISNAYAYTNNGTRYIIIDVAWINSIKSNNWFISGILAHEIGHHLCGHTSPKVGYISLEEKRKRELEADKFAGFILKSIGANMDQALTTINSLVPVDFDDRTSTHPTKSKRIAAIKSGFYKTDNISPTNNSLMAKNYSSEYYFNKANNMGNFPDQYTPTNTLLLQAENYKKAIDINPNYYDANFKLGLIYQSLGTQNSQYKKSYYDLSFYYYNETLKISSYSPGVYNNMGMLYAQIGYDYTDYNSYITAINYYNKAISLDQRDGVAYLNRGVAYLNIGYNFRQPTLPNACNDFNIACQLGEQKACNHYNKACLRRRGY